MANAQTNSAQLFQAGTPSGISNVTRDANGQLTAWVENGFAMSVTRTAAGLPLRLVATGPRGRLVQTFAFDASGRLSGLTGDMIPTEFAQELQLGVPALLASASQAGAVQALVSGGGNLQANTVWIAGDSLMANAWAQVGSPVNFYNRGAEGWFNWLDAALGAPFSVLGSSAIGGKDTADFMTRQLPLVIASGAKYCALSIGINDINVDLLSGAQTAANVIQCVQALVNAGITPIWSTLFPQTYDSVVTPNVQKANDALRLFAQSNSCGMFVDLYPARVDPTNPQNPSRGAGYSYDSPAYLHPNNLGAALTGIYGASQISSRLLPKNASQWGNEDVTYTAGSNLLSNPGFTGTGGTVSANCTGTMPTGWAVDWATRTGTGSAAAAIVSITDTATGLALAQGIQLTVSGSAASGDVLRVYQSDTQNAALKSTLTTGSVVQAEGTFSLASAANISQVAMRVQTNTTESTWWGSNAQAAGTYPASLPAMAMRTQPMTVLGSGAASQARYDFRVSFNGAGTGSVITLWRPRVRQVS